MDSLDLGGVDLRKRSSSRTYSPRIRGGTANLISRGLPKHTPTIRAIHRPSTTTGNSSTRIYYLDPASAPILTATPNSTPSTAATDAANATPLHAAAAAAALPGRVVAGSPSAPQPPCSSAWPASGAGASRASASSSAGCRRRRRRRTGPTAALPTYRGQQRNSCPRQRHRAPRPRERHTGEHRDWHD